MPQTVNINGVGKVNFPDNFTPEQITNAIENDILPNAKNAYVETRRTIPQELVRQAGLTTRDLIEGGASTIGLLSDPIAAAMRAGGLDVKNAADLGASVADRLGLPRPENSTERIANETAKMLVGTGGLMKGAGAAANIVSTPIAKGALTNLAANADLQAASTLGGGVSGGVAKEGGAGAGGQFVAALAGGLAAPLAYSATITPVAQRINNFVQSKQLEKQADQIIAAADVQPDVAKLIRNDVTEALKTGNNISPDAVRRLAEYKLVGATPMRSNLSLNPAEITADRNLSKLGANSKDPAALRLANLQRENDLVLMRGLNNLGAEHAEDSVTAANKIINALQIKDEGARANIKKYYDVAKNTQGRSAQLDAYAFTQRANDLLDQNLLGGQLPSDVRNVLNNIAQGKTPFTVDVAEQYKTAIGNLQRSTNDRSVKAALGMVRQAMEETPLVSGQGDEAIAAFNNARKVNRDYMQIVERTPALQAVRDGVEPDKFMQTYILGTGGKSNISDVAALKDSLKGNPEAIKTIKNQIVSYLKNKATGGNADEMANFSPSAYKKALAQIGDSKLNMFFSPDDVKMLKTIANVASYEKFQPTGSAVNNSNTASTAIGSLLNFIGNSPVLRKVPLANKLAESARDASMASRAEATLKPSAALTVKNQAKKPKTLPLSTLLLPVSEQEGNN